MTLRLMLADDHTAFREALCLFLELQADIRVVSEVTDGHGVLREFTPSQPDVVCMDVNMQGFSGIQATRELLRQHANARVIGLSAHVDLRRVAEMLGAGALGYVVKGSPGAELLAAIRAVGRGEVYLSPELGIASVADLARYAIPPG